MKNIINVTNTSNVKTCILSVCESLQYSPIVTINAYIGMIWMDILFSLVKRASFFVSIFAIIIQVHVRKDGNTFSVISDTGYVSRLTFYTRLNDTCRLTCFKNEYKS